MKRIFELIDEAKDLHGKIAATWNEKEELSSSLIVGWIDHNTKLLTEVAKKCEELEERLDTMHAEAKKKGWFG